VRHTFRLGVLALAALLGGCASGPSERADTTVRNDRAVQNGELIFARAGAYTDSSTRAALYRVDPADDGTAERFGADRFEEVGFGAVALSPDGREIAFTRRTRLWVSRADGSAARPVGKQMRDSTLPSWSPDGSRLIYHQVGDEGASGYTAHLVNADGTGYRKLGLDSEHPFSEAWWSGPDEIMGVAGGESGLPLQLYRIELAGGPPEAVVPPSPKNRWFVVERGQPIIVIRETDGPERLQLWLHRDDDERLLAEAESFQGVEWAPDGSRIAVVAAFEREQTTRLVLIPREAEAMRLTPASGVEGFRPLWSPDSREVVFNRGVFPHSDLWTVDVRGHERRLTDDRAVEFALAWLPADVVTD
jgi:dipeptidyl aminopeptidase/acylaminoacyl peptidase